MKNFFSFAAIVAAMFTLFACGGKDLGVVSIADPAVTGALKDYIQVVKVSPVAFVREEGRVSSSLQSYFDYAKGSITIKCIKSPEDVNLWNNDIVVLLDDNGTPIYDGQGRITGKNSDSLICSSDIKEMTEGEEKTINYKICIREDLSSSQGPVTDEDVIKKIFGPVKFVQIAG